MLSWRNNFKFKTIWKYTSFGKKYTYLVSKTGLLKNIQRRCSSRRFIVRKIFNDNFHIFQRDWPKIIFFLKFIFTFYFDDTWMVVEFYNDSSKLFIKYVFVIRGSKLFHVSAVSAKCLLEVLTILSLFTSKVSFLINSF